MKQDKIRSYLMLIASMLIFGSIGIFRRNIALPSALIATVRGIIGSVCLLIFSFLQKQSNRVKISIADRILFIISGAAMGMNWILLFEAYEYTTVATATLCYYMMPTIVILLSPIVFKDRLSKKKLICAAIGIVGMTLLSGIFSDAHPSENTMTGILYGLSAAALYAFVVILNKKIQAEAFYTKTVIQLFTAGIVLLPYLLITGELAVVSVNKSDILLLILLGVVHTGIAYLLYFGSLKELSAQSVAIISYIDPVFAMILSVFVMNEPLTEWGLLGSAFIIGSALCSELTS